MSPIITMRKFTMLLAVVAAVAAGCGTPNDKSGFDSDQQKHVDGWILTKHAPAAQANLASCAECHGDNLLGGQSGVSCGKCHNDVINAMSGCTSCHGRPPAGNVAPNRNGGHATHRVLANVANVCDTCHNGAGTTSAQHYNGAVDVLFLSVYDAQSGAAVRNADGSCSAVSCHGGQTTPVWLTGTIDVNSECGACHAYGTSEYNSYSSGRHNSHVNTYGFACTICHSTSKLAAVHFNGLNTSIMEGPASATLNSSVTYTGGSCTPQCHSSRSW